MNLCLVGKASSGKDFVGDYIINKYGFTRYAFADNVKSVAEVWFPDMYTNKEEKPRALLQAIGTKFREIDAEVWIKSMFEEIDEQKKISKNYNLEEEHVVITDCRLPNEYEALKERGFIFIRIEVDDVMRLQRMRNRGDIFSGEDMLHHTEQYYDTFECEYSLSNNGSKESTYQQVDEIMNQIMSRNK